MYLSYEQIATWRFESEVHMKIQKSAEDYLEAILALGGGGEDVRSVDVSRYLSVTRASVSRAMSGLRAEGYVTMDDSGYLGLTDTGREIAAKIYERHRLLTEWLQCIGVSPETAEADACKIEHDLSPETFQRLKEYIEGMQ